MHVNVASFKVAPPWPPSSNKVCVSAGVGEHHSHQSAAILAV